MGTRSLFGRISRTEKDIPENKATRAQSCYLLRQQTARTAKDNLAQRDLALIQHLVRLHSSKDLARLTDLGPSTG